MHDEVGRSGGKVLLVGLDAAEWGLIERLIDEGELPTLAKLAAGSTAVHLEAPPTFKAEGRWAEFLTGKTAEESQYWSINELDPRTYTP